MEKELEGILNHLQSKDEDFEEYVNIKCNKAVSQCREYMEKEFSDKYSEEELSLLREKLIYKEAWMSAMQFCFTYNKL
ncbi:MAG: hypothetical protein ACK5JH_15745 [Anaerocolumna sp.]